MLFCLCPFIKNVFIFGILISGHLT